MFDDRVWQERHPPRPARLSITRALPALSGASMHADKIPLWLRTEGVRLEEVMDAEVIGACRLIDGQWLGNVRIRPLIGSSSYVSMSLWVPSSAIEPWPDGNLNRRPLGSDRVFGRQDR